MAEKNESQSNDNKDKKSDLDDLLDSALEDFGKVENAEKQKREGDANASVGNGTEGDELWNEEFFAEQAKLLNERMNAIFNSAGGNEQVSTDQIAVGFQKMAEAAAIALQSNNDLDESSTKYADSISEALKGLKDGVTNLQAPVSDTDIANMFSGLSFSEGDGNDSNPFLPFMHGMMQNLLSAEILLPSIKELLDKYPKYLEENSSKISAADKERYVKQQELFKIICVDLEAEKPSDSTEIKQERFKRVLDNMQKLHEYGQPPEDLIGEIGGGGELPGFSGAATQNQQCPLM